MFAKCLLAGVAIVAFATPALSDQFFIVHDAAAKRCVIAERPPAAGAGTLVGDGAYGDRASAEADMRTMFACMSQAAGSGTRSQEPPASAR
jgi:hypothetical protein